MSKSYQIYTSLTHIADLASLPFDELCQYARDLRSIGFENNSRDDDAKKCLEVAQELIKRIEGECSKDKKIEPKPSSNNRDTQYSQATYRFLFAICDVALRTEKTEVVEKSWEELKKFLRSEKILIEAKYVILNGFANESRDDRSSTHRDLKNAFKIMTDGKEEDRNKVIREVFQDAKNRYFSGNKKIYEHEESPTFILWQSWNGKDANDPDVKLIKRLAEEYYENRIDDLSTTLDQTSGSDNEPDVPFSRSEIAESILTKFQNTSSENPKIKRLKTSFSQLKARSEEWKKEYGESIIEGSLNGKSKPLFEAIINQEGYEDIKNFSFRPTPNNN